jgi:tyrosyl-tRNA synthetase
MPRYGQTAQMVLTVPLLVGTDAKVVDGAIVGRKMSKSADNYIGLAEEPLVMFRKTMQVDDDVILRYFELLSLRPSEEVARLRAERAAGRDPREIKALFAQEIVTRFHDADAAAAAERAFKSIYGADAVPDDVPEFKVATAGPTLSIVKALSAAGLVKSNGEGKRLVEQGGVEVDRKRVTDGQLQLDRGNRYLLKAGSKTRRFAYVTVEGT